MISILIFVILVLAVIFYSIVVNWGESGGQTAQVKIGENVFNVEIAKSIRELSKGLAGHAPLLDDQGMLFVFSWRGTQNFWMKGMEFPIDIIWIKDGQILGIEKNVPPPGENGGETPTYSSPEPVDRVLEINAGLSDKIGINKGDKVEILIGDKKEL